MRSKQSALDTKLYELGKNRNTKMYTGDGELEKSDDVAPGARRMSTRQIWQNRKIDRKGEKDLRDWRKHAN